MKTLPSFVCIAFILPMTVVNAQKNECDRYLRDADAAVQNGQYRSALLIYNAALVCDPQRKNVIDEKILAVFDKIELQKVEAVKAKQQLDVAKKQVEKERDRAIAASKEAQRQSEIAENSSMASQNAALVLQTISSNPTLALELARVNKKMFPDNSVANVAYHKVLGDTTLCFYKKSLEMGAKALCITISPNGKLAGAGLANGKIAIWNPQAENPQLYFLQAHRTNEVRSVKFSPDGSLLFSAGSDKKAKLWTINAGVPDTIPIRTFEEKSEAINSVAFSTDGQELLIGYELGLIQCWSLTPSDSPVVEVNYKNPLRVVGFSPDGAYILGAGNDNNAWIWKRSEPLKPFKILRAHLGDLSSALFSADGKWLLTSSIDGICMLWDWQNDDKPSQKFEGHTDLVEFAVFSPDQKQILSGSGDNTMKTWSLDGKVLHTYRGHASSVRDGVWSPDGITFWSAGSDSTIKNWSFAPRLGVITSRQLHDKQVMVIRSDYISGNLYTAGGDGKLTCWPGTKDDVLPIQEHVCDRAILDLAVQPGGKRVATCSRDSLVKIWDFSGGGFRLRQTLRNASAEVQHLAISADGRYLAASSADSLVWFWDLNKPSPLSIPISGHKGLVSALAFSPDGRFLAVGSEDNLARIWEIAGAGAPRLSQTLTGHFALVTDLFFLSDGKTMISGSADAKLRRWQLNTPPSLISTYTFAKRIYTDRMLAAVSADGAQVAACQENLVKIWQLNDEEQAFSFPVSQKINLTSIEFDPSGFFIWVGYDDGHVAKWACPDYFVAQQVAQIPFFQMVRSGLQVHYDSLLSSKDPILLATLGGALFQKGDLDASRKFWEKALQLNPSTDNRLGLYLTETRLGMDNSESILQSNDLPLLEKFGQHFLETGSWNMAYRFFEKIHLLQPQNIPALVNLYEVALRAARPFDMDLFLNLNETALYDRSMAALLNALQLKSRRSTWDQRIDLYNTLLLIFDRARTRDSAYFNVRKYLWPASTWCTNLAELVARRGDTPRAIFYLDRAEAFDPTWYATYLMRPMILIQANRFDEARAFYLKKAPDKFNPSQGLPTYRDQFLRDLEQMEKRNDFTATQLAAIADLKKILVEMP